MIILQIAHGQLAATAATMPATAMSALSTSAVFTAAIMARIPGVTLPVSRLVRMKVIERLLPTFGNRAIVATTRIITIVNVAVEAMTAMEPWAGSDE
jgi:predicted NAD/FAD-binding protein